MLPSLARLPSPETAAALPASISEPVAADAIPKAPPIPDKVPPIRPLPKVFTAKSLDASKALLFSKARDFLP